MQYNETFHKIEQYILYIFIYIYNVIHKKNL